LDVCADRTETRRRRHRGLPGFLVRVVPGFPQARAAAAGWCVFVIYATMPVAVTVIVQDHAAFGGSAPILLDLGGVAISR
jgi:hypothetical protein